MIRCAVRSFPGVQAGWPGFLADLVAPHQVDVRHVEVRVSAVEDNYLHLGVGFQAVDEGGQARDDLGVVQVDRRVVEGDLPVGGAVLADADRRCGGHRNGSSC